MQLDAKKVRREAKARTCMALGMLVKGTFIPHTYLINWQSRSLTIAVRFFFIVSGRWTWRTLLALHFSSSVARLGSLRVSSRHAISENASKRLLYYQIWTPHGRASASSTSHNPMYPTSTSNRPSTSAVAQWKRAGLILVWSGGLWIETTLR